MCRDCVARTTKASREEEHLTAELKSGEDGDKWQFLTHGLTIYSVTVVAGHQSFLQGD